ncbi:hypothetical protein ACFLQX_01875 [Bacteroidota bacterium]
MNKIFNLLIPLIIVILFSSACNRKIAPESVIQYDKVTTIDLGTDIVEGNLERPINMVPGKPSESRHAVIEEYFKDIVNNEVAGENTLLIQEVMELCESAETPVEVIRYTDTDNYKFIQCTIREYLEYLDDLKQYEDDVDEIVYSDVGKIKKLMLSKDRIKMALMQTKPVFISPETSTPARFAVLDGHFRNIADSTLSNEAPGHMGEVLFMCESFDVPVRIFSAEDTQSSLEELGIREYLNRIFEEGFFPESIHEVVHNPYGDISSISLLKEPRSRQE